MNDAGGIQLAGSTPVSLTVDHASFNTRSTNGIDAMLSDALDLSVTNSHIYAYEHRLTVKVRCRKRLNVHILNSTIRSTRSRALDIGGYATQATIVAESSNFNGWVRIADSIQRLVCLVR